MERRWSYLHGIWGCYCKWANCVGRVLFSHRVSQSVVANADSVLLLLFVVADRMRMAKVQICLPAIRLRRRWLRSMRWRYQRKISGWANSLANMVSWSVHKSFRLAVARSFKVCVGVCRLARFGQYHRHHHLRQLFTGRRVALGMCRLVYRIWLPIWFIY